MHRERSRANRAALVRAGAGSIAPGRACPVVATIGCRSRMLCSPVCRLVPPWMVRQGSPSVHETAPRTYRQVASCQDIQSMMRPLASRESTRVPWIDPIVRTSASIHGSLSGRTASGPAAAVMHCASRSIVHVHGICATAAVPAASGTTRSDRRDHARLAVGRTSRLDAFRPGSRTASQLEPLPTAERQCPKSHRNPRRASDAFP